MPDRVGAGRWSTHCRLMWGGNLKEFFCMWSCWTFPGCPAWIAPVISKAQESLSSREQASRKYSVEVRVFSLMRSYGKRQPDRLILRGEPGKGMLAAGMTRPGRIPEVMYPAMPGAQPCPHSAGGLYRLIGIHPRSKTKNSWPPKAAFPFCTD